MFEGGFDICALAQMFDDCKKDQGDEEPQETFEQIIEAKEKETFWDEDEITPVGFYKDITDERPEPSYVVHHKQCIGVEDAYLGLNMNDPSNSNIDAIVITVKLENTKPDEIDLNVQNGYLDLRTPKYHLTHKLDRVTIDDKTTAKWNPDESNLTIEVPVKRTEIKLV